MSFGPKPIGAWSGKNAPNCGASHGFLQGGKHYTVIKEFVDFDRHAHPVGEKWVFLGYSFLPHDDGMSFFVSFDGKQEWHIRLQWLPEEQGHVLDNLSEYIRSI